MTTPSTITRRDFVRQFSDGIDLQSPRLQQELGRAGISPDRLDRLDRNRDGQLRGAELHRAFRLIDRFDRDGSAHSFVGAGRANALYQALQAGRKEPKAGLDVAMAALSRAQHMGDDYAVGSAPTSPHPRLSHNDQPGVTRLNWLRDHNKCNQFVGDALTEAGLEMPTYRMRDGSLHFMNAEALPRQTGHFSRVTDAAQIRPGDVIVVDYPGRGANSAHTEVVTGRDAAGGTLFTAGAHFNGAYERDWSQLLDGASVNARQQRWDKADGTQVYVLRPNRALKESRSVGPLTPGESRSVGPIRLGESRSVGPLRPGESRSVGPLRPGG